MINHYFTLKILSLYIFVCAYVYACGVLACGVCVSMYLSVSLYWAKRRDITWPPLTLFLWDRVSHWTWSKAGSQLVLGTLFSALYSAGMAVVCGQRCPASFPVSSSELWVLKSEGSCFLQEHSSQRPSLSPHFTLFSESQLGSFSTRHIQILGVSALALHYNVK